MDIKDEADTFWAAFDEHVSDVLPGYVLAQEFYEKFMEAHCGMFKKLNLEQLEDMAREIFMFLREQELKDAGAGGRCRGQMRRTFGGYHAMYYGCTKDSILSKIFLKKKICTIL